MRILFVCEGNINRSQMAAAYLKKIAPNVEVVSAGTVVPPERHGKRVEEISSKGDSAMREVGLSTAENVVQMVTPEMVDDADKVILMGNLQSLPDYIKNSPKVEIWNIPDPGKGEATHAETRDAVIEEVSRMSESLGLSTK